MKDNKSQTKKNSGAVANQTPQKKGQGKSLSSASSETAQLWPFGAKKEAKKEPVIGLPTNVSSTNDQATTPIASPLLTEPKVEGDPGISSPMIPFGPKNKPKPKPSGRKVLEGLSIDAATRLHEGEEEDDVSTVADIENDTVGLISGTLTSTDPAPTYVDGTKDEKGKDITKYAANDQKQRDKSDQEKAGAAFGVGLGLASPILSFYLAVKKLSDDDINAKIEGGFDTLGSVASAVKAGADVGVTLNEDDATAAATSAIAGSVADGLAALKTGVLTIKQIYEDYKTASSEIGSSKGDKKVAALTALKGLLNSASSAVSSLKALLDLFEKGSAGMANAVPGLGIALSGVQVAIDVYNIMRAKTNEGFVSAQLQKNQWESTIGGGKARDKRQKQGDNTAIFKEEITGYNEKLDALLAARAQLVASDKPAAVSEIDKEKTFGDGGLTKEEWAAITLQAQKIKECDDNIKIVTDLKAGLDPSEDIKLKNANSKLKAYEAKKAALVAAFGQSVSSAQLDEKIKILKENRTLAIESLAKLDENTALTNLKQVNADRQADSGFSIGVELTKIVASVLSLVPEPGSQVASVTLKAVASGATLAKKAGGKIAQSARDHAAANKDSVLNTVFNVDTTRSSDKETERKKTATKYILKSIQSCDIHDPAEADKLTALVESSGVSAQTLTRAFNKGGFTEAVKVLMKAQG